MSKEPEDKSSVDHLKLAVLYKKLEAKKDKGLSPGEEKLFAELSQKLGNKLEAVKASSVPDTPIRDSRVYTHEPLQIKSRRDFEKFYLRNISGGGVYLESNTSHPIGTQIDFELDWVDKKKKLQFRGEVAWINPKTLGDLKPGFGVKFVNPTDEQSRMIKEMILHLLNKATATADQKKK